MRLLIITAFALVPALAISQDFRFERDNIKFDKTPEGEVLEFVYVFENTGTAPLLINDIKVTCGCTVPVYPRNPVAPGKRDTIHVTFNTAGKIGYQDRTLEIFSNAKGAPHKLRFRGVVDNKAANSNREED